MSTIPSARGAAPLAQRRILVVEDEALIGMMIEDGLREAGAIVLGPVASLRDALRLVETAMADGGIDAGVLDLNLAGELVLPVADALVGHGVPFLVATGYGEEGLTEPHADIPVLRKPFLPQELLVTIQELVEGSAVQGSASSASAASG